MHLLINDETGTISVPFEDYNALWAEYQKNKKILDEIDKMTFLHDEVSVLDAVADLKRSFVQVWNAYQDLATKEPKKSKIQRLQKKIRFYKGKAQHWEANARYNARSKREGREKMKAHYQGVIKQLENKIGALEFQRDAHVDLLDDIRSLAKVNVRSGFELLREITILSNKGESNNDHQTANI